MLAAPSVVLIGILSYYMLLVSSFMCNGVLIYEGKVVAKKAVKELKERTIEGHVLVVRDQEQRRF